MSIPQDDLQAWIAARLRDMRLVSGLGEAGAGDLAHMSQSKVSELEYGVLASPERRPRLASTKVRPLLTGGARKQVTGSFRFLKPR